MKVWYKAWAENKSSNFISLQYCGIRIIVIIIIYMFSYVATNVIFTFRRVRPFI